MNALMVRELFSLRKDDVQIVTLPLFHTFGQTCQMNAGFSMANTQILIPKFAPEAVLDAIQNGNPKNRCVLAGLLLRTLQ